MNQILEFYDKDFKAPKIKMIQQTITNCLKINLKKGKSQQSDRSHKTNGNYLTENYNSKQKTNNKVAVVK